jgi:drug/metabolite transporter (DMT)-like permease
MTKLLIILLIGLVFESTGVVLLKKGMTQIGDIKKINVSEVLRVMKSSVTSPQILLGVFFEALFFGCLLVLMSRSDISFLWPLTGLSFVFATFAAILFLGEQVSTIRWVGVALIVLGAGFISYSEKRGDLPKLSTPTADSSSVSPGAQ